MNRLGYKRRRKKLEEAAAAGGSCLVLDDLHENCIHHIIGRLPLESLFTSKLVCKSWYGIITSPYFRNKQYLRGRLDVETRGIIFSAPVENYSPPPKKVFSVESGSTITDLHSSFHIKFMDFNNEGGGKIRGYNTSFRGRIVAARDGLVVLEEHLCTRRLVLFNPVTKELEDIPMGTTSSVPDGDLYGLAFCHGYYKLLHLFMKDEIRSLGCEIMDIIGSGGSMSWRAVDVPPTERFKMLHSPIFAMGALHWIQYVCGHGECVVSMPLDDEKFKTTEIPPAAKVGPFNTIFEMGEFLGFSSRGEGNQIQVWILRGSDDDYYWEKQYDINGRGVGYLTPLLYYEGDDKLVLKCFGDKCFYAYDRHSGDLKKSRRITNGLPNTGPFSHMSTVSSRGGVEDST